VQSEAPLGPPRGGRVSRRVRHFPISPGGRHPSRRARLLPRALSDRADRPGLLYAVARTLARYRSTCRPRASTRSADRAEDVFLVSGEALSNSKSVLLLEQDLLKELQI
jgi:[protein-PII] uridylyltransferase